MSAINTLEPGKKSFKFNNKDNRTPFVKVVLVYLFFSLNLDMSHIYFPAAFIVDYQHVNAK